MSGLTIVLSQALPAFHPGEAVEGEVQWNLTEPTDELMLELIWMTQTKSGSEDEEVAGCERFAVTDLKGSAKFRFELPESPWSFEGRLFSVKWRLELAGDDVVRTEIVVSPTGQPIRPSV